MRESAGQGPILVLGIGNLVMSDDGVGVRVVQNLADCCRFPESVELLDGGTLGLDLLPRLEGIARLLVIDAMETGGPPGTLVRLTGSDIPVALETKLSPHQMGLKDLLAVARLQGFAPDEMVLLGVQPACIEMGLELSPEVAGRVAELEDQVVRQLGAWGAEVAAA